MSAVNGGVVNSQFLENAWSIILAQKQPKLMDRDYKHKKIYDPSTPHEIIWFDSTLISLQ